MLMIRKTTYTVREYKLYYNHIYRLSKTHLAPQIKNATAALIPCTAFIT